MREHFLGVFFIILLWTIPSFGEEWVRVRLFSHSQPSLVASGLSLKYSAGDKGIERVKAWSGFEKLKINWQKASQAQTAKWVIEKPSGKLAEKEGSFLKLTGESMVIGGSSVPRSILIFPSPKGGLDIVAQLDMEAYLLGVLASEMPASWPLEALKAQAVATRTYTLHALQEAQQSSYYHLESSVLDQVFKHPEQLKLAPKYRHKVLQAIQLTKGQVLVDRQGQIIKAYYHADCGGESEEASYVWAGAAGQGRAKDPFCPQSPAARWSYQISRKAFEKALAPLLGVERPQLLKVKSFGQTPSGRVHYLHLEYKTGSPASRRLKLINSQKLREYIGFNKIKSTAFNMSQINGIYRFKGQGHGHGVGLCQWGSRAQALKGRSYWDILKHYYPKAKLKPFSAPKMPVAKAKSLSVDA